VSKHRRSVEKEVFWRDQIGRQAASGVSIRQYCRDHELSEASFYLWRRELRLRDRENSANGGLPSGLVAVDVVGSASEAKLEIAFRDGVVIRLREDVSGDTLERVLAVVCRQNGVACVGAEEVASC